MGKDLKIGFALGLLIVAAAAVWLSTRPSLSIKERLLQSRKMKLVQNAEIKKQKADYKPDKQHKAIKFHIVRKNETLIDISRQCYGTAGGWKKILTANNIHDPTRIKPGTKLIIPE